MREVCLFIRSFLFVVRIADRTNFCLDQNFLFTESLILAQNERWRRGLGMQVERNFSFFEV